MTSPAFPDPQADSGGQTYVRSPCPRLSRLSTCVLASFRLVEIGKKCSALIVEGLLLAPIQFLKLVDVLILGFTNARLAVVASCLPSVMAVLIAVIWSGVQPFVTAELALRTEIETERF